MTDYTIVNLHELEDMAPKFGTDKYMETRFATKPLQLKKSGLGIQKVLPHSTIPYKHRHTEQEEVFIIVQGSGSMHLDNEIIDLKTWDAVRVPPGVVRTVTGGPEGLEMIIVGAPHLEANDIEMVSE